MRNGPVRSFGIYYDHDPSRLIGSVTLYDENLSDEMLSRMVVSPAFHQHEIKANTGDPIDPKSTGPREMKAYGLVPMPPEMQP